MKIVIVESPAKAKTIQKYLGTGYRVCACFGHVRDLPSKEGSVLPDKDFHMIYELSSHHRKYLKEITKVAQSASALYLATDPDREGEAIAWHMKEVLASKKALPQSVKRIVFSEITKSAIEASLPQARAISMDLVNAQQARRALDYLVGFTLSPVLWKKIPSARSAGRVQSVALRLIYERECDILAFVPQEYWSIEGNFIQKGKSFVATLVEKEEERLEKCAISTEDLAAAYVEDIKKRDFSIVHQVEKTLYRHPPPAFITSTLQQEASQKLGLSVSQVMRHAQQLYEGIGEQGGLITYMRTDSPHMSKEALLAARAVIASSFDKAYLPVAARKFKASSKVAQEAHEAIRPTQFSLLPSQVQSLSSQQLGLYDLIWKRALASQMQSATFKQGTVILKDAEKKWTFKATGSEVIFDGFLKLYPPSSGDKEKKTKEKMLPSLEEGAVHQERMTSFGHVTTPPHRYREATLVKKLEELGIGRPSTYASIIDILKKREYVTLKDRKFVCQQRGAVVTIFLKHFFPQYITYMFTAELETKLDHIATGNVSWKKVLGEFWDPFCALSKSVNHSSREDVMKAIQLELVSFVCPKDNPQEMLKSCPACGKGTLGIKVGKGRFFLGCSEYPSCTHTRNLGDEETMTENNQAFTKVLGKNPTSGEEVLVKKGPFGYYLEEHVPDKKPKRVSLKPPLDPHRITLEEALKLLVFPKLLGKHPETKEEIFVRLGRYGPYLDHNGKYAKLSSVEEAMEVGLNRAIVLLKEGRNGGSKRQVLKVLGEHPEGGGTVEILQGRYGPYVTHKRINVSLKKTGATDLTLEEAVELLAAKSRTK